MISTTTLSGSAINSFVVFRRGQEIVTRKAWACRPAECNKIPPEIYMNHLLGSSHASRPSSSGCIIVEGLLNAFEINAANCVPLKHPLQGSLTSKSCGSSIVSSCFRPCSTSFPEWLRASGSRGPGRLSERSDAFSSDFLNGFNRRALSGPQRGCQRVVLPVSGVRRGLKVLAAKQVQRSRLKEDVGQVVLRGLNREQSDAVQAPPGPIRVVAGPGSGKTRVLTSRVAYIIATEGVKPANILGITFTNRAAAEVKQRLEGLLGPHGVSGLSVGTFHAIGARILRASVGSMPECGLNSDFVIFDDADCIKLCKGAVEELQKRSGFKDAAKVLHALSALKYDRSVKVVAGKRRKPSKGTSMGAKAVETLDVLLGKGGALALLRLYENRLRSCNAVDFDDLILLTVELFHNAPHVLQYYRKRFTHVLVDEFQDTDEAQYELVRLLSCEHCNLFVVGDIDQAIYGWRGANPKNMQMELESDFPSLKTLLLKSNYRSSRAILEAAGRVIRRSEVDRSFGSTGPLSLEPTKAVGRPVSVAYVGSDRAEANLVVSTIQGLADTGQSWGNFAVMYRRHSQSRVLEEALARARIPFVVLGGMPFYARKEIKDLLAYLRLIANPMDQVALERIINVPARAIGETTWGKLITWTKSMGLPLAVALQEFGPALPPKEELGITARARTAVAGFSMLLAELIELSRDVDPGELLRKLLDRIEYKRHLAKEESKEEDKGEDSWLRVLDLLSIADDAGRRLGSGRDALLAFLEDLALVSSADSEDGKQTRKGRLEAKAVKLMSIHASKGLEFPTVFVTGLEEGVLPLTRSMDDLEEIAEERRLCYVAMTRAEERLFLSHCHLRYQFGRPMDNKVSRFLKGVHPFYSDLVSGEEEEGTRVRPSFGWHTVDHDPSS